MTLSEKQQESLTNSASGHKPIMVENLEGRVRPAKCGQKKLLLYFSVLSLITGVIVTLVGHYSEPSWKLDDSSCTKLCQDSRRLTERNIKNCRLVGPIILAFGLVLLMVSVYKFWRRNRTGLKWHFRSHSEKNEQNRRSQDPFTHFLGKHYRSDSQLRETNNNLEPVLSFTALAECLPSKHNRTAHLSSDIFSSTSNTTKREELFLESEIGESTDEMDGSKTQQSTKRSVKDLYSPLHPISVVKSQK